MYEELKTAAATQPVTVTEQATYSRIDVPATGSDEETLVNSLIASATTQAETISRRALITQTWLYHLDGFPPYHYCVPYWKDRREVTLFPQYRADIILPHPPVQSVTSITYVDGNGNSQTVDPAIYTLEKSSPARLVLKEGESWPTAALITDSVTIEYVAGYGSAETDVPDGIRLAIKFYANCLYDRVPLADAQKAMNSLLAQYKVYSFPVGV